MKRYHKNDYCREGHEAAVDEKDLVAFYTDTKHHIFPRSANVIGREECNCHPRTSVYIIEEINEKIKSGEEDQVDFWINKPGAFIYVLYRPFAMKKEILRVFLR